MYKKRDENGSLSQTLVSIFEIIVINIFTLPFDIFYKSYINLSLWSYEKEKYGEEFPVLNWYRGFFDCLIFLSIPVGLIVWFFILEFDFSWIIIVYSYLLLPSISLVKEITLLPLSLTSIIIRKLNDSVVKNNNEGEKNNIKKPIIKKKETKTESLSKKPGDEFNYPDGHPLKK